MALSRDEESQADLARKWKLSHLLTGNIRRNGSTLRFSYHLVEVSSWQHTLSDRFDADVEDVFSVQDEITGKVASMLARHIDHERLVQAREKAHASMEAYDCWLRGCDCLRRGTLEADEEARGYFLHALEIDPNYARAYAGLSLSHFNEWSCQTWHLWDDAERPAFENAAKAVALDDRDPMVHTILARVHLYRADYAKAEQNLRRASSLNPNDANVLIQLSVAELLMGNPERSLELTDRAMELNPAHGDWYFGIKGWARFMQKRYTEARADLLKAEHTIMFFPLYLAACSAIAGDHEEAAARREQFLHLYRTKISFGREPEPAEVLRWFLQTPPYRRTEDRTHLREVMVQAGLRDIDCDVDELLRPSNLVQPANLETPANNCFRREGKIWNIAYAGRGAQLTELKGFHDLARLLAQPGEQLHCLEFSGGAVADQSGGQEVLDGQARRAYRKRIEELQQDLEEAESMNDPGRAEKARRELDLLLDELSRTTGLRGKSRTFSNAAERARMAITWRIRSAIKKITAAHPELGKHLANSIRTGALCEYSPEKITTWEL